MLVPNDITKSAAYSVSGHDVFLQSSPSRFIAWRRGTIGCDTPSEPSAPCQPNFWLCASSTANSQNPEPAERREGPAGQVAAWVGVGRGAHLRLDDRPVPRQLQRPPARAAQPIVRHAAILLALRQRIPRRERDPVVDVEVEIRGQLLVGLGDVAADPGVPSLRVCDLDAV